MIKKDFSVCVNDEIIAATILSKNSNSSLPRFIFLHGAGAGNKEKVHNIAFPIINLGINILTLDFSGHGESTGDLKKSSLQKRVNEAKTVINTFASKEPLVICGFSMGGYVAIKLLDLYKIDTIVLFCPALYDKKAYSVSFDNGFTEIIRATESWRKTDAITSLEKFTGNLLIVIGESDEIIPSGVIELIVRHTPNAKKKEVYIIPNCPHRINTWIEGKKIELEKLHQKIIEYVS